MVLQRIKKIGIACRQIAFPDICVCCGKSLILPKKLICDWCKKDRFEQPNRSNKEILPNSVLSKYSMWAFDKGGYLQDLLHKLKYHRLNNIGMELGEYLGNKYLKSEEYRRRNFGKNPNFLIIPIPLHKKKQRKRGYNQARSIANGIVKATGWDIISEGEITRQKNTSTQTGLTTKQRSENIKGAFDWRRNPGKDEFIPVIVDDVFTTGATTFELADLIMAKSGEKSIILTIAQA